MPRTNKSQKETAAIVPAKKAARRTIRSPAYFEIYVNASQGAYTPWDIQITLGKLDKIDGLPGVVELLGISMSPPHAKALLGVLASAIQGYETKYGEIKLSSVHLPMITDESTPSKA